MAGAGLHGGYGTQTNLFNVHNQLILTLTGWLQGGICALLPAGIKYWQHPKILGKMNQY